MEGVGGGNKVNKSGDVGCPGVVREVTGEVSGGRPSRALNASLSGIG